MKLFDDLKTLWNITYRAPEIAAEQEKLIHEFLYGNRPKELDLRIVA